MTDILRGAEALIVRKRAVAIVPRSTIFVAIIMDYYDKNKIDI